MAKAPERERREIAVRGIVQGVGFRPFVYSLARRLGLTGWVRNSAAGVQIEVEGFSADLDGFLRGIETESPPLAVVETVRWQPCEVRGEHEFRIQESQAGDHRHALIAPDVAVCADCVRELFDPSDRRYRYPFINCTNCGPRFTITLSVPYDRSTTTMAGFPMCTACLSEYEDPSNRRFHAQPNACSDCGPRARLLDASGVEITETDAIQRAAELLADGSVLAVKGLGGFHLACSPFNPAAVAALRSRKARQDKPFALMAADLDQASALGSIGPAAAAALTALARPIVLLDRREDAGISADVAPRQKTIGIMLAYTPLHHLLLRDAGAPLVMTSGNRSDEPIAYQDEDALQQLGGIADYFLTHNRPIHMRCDDSVVRIFGCRAPAVGAADLPIPDTRGYPPGATACLLRRSRGYAPAPLRVATRFDRHVLACGGELKNTLCVAKDEHVFLSHHIGDLENYETLRSFREGIEHFRRLFDVQPELVAYDLHPGYLSTRYALEMEEAGLPAMGVQHHHAHVASCLADNERPDDEYVIGVAMDGTGYGADGAIWGGEFFTGSIQEGFIRRAHLEYMPLPGGETAIRQPWRMAVAQLIRLYGEEETLKLPLSVIRDSGPSAVRQIARLLEHRMNTPLTSSAGRLFDAVAALVGVPGTRQTTYEGQAAIELELAARGNVLRSYPFRLLPDGDNWIVDTSAILRGVVEDIVAGTPAADISGRFHRTMAEIITAGCSRIRESLPTTPNSRYAVTVSGGTFQNRLLLETAYDLMERQGFPVYCHRRVPTNDGGICLGQAVLANRKSK